VARAQVAILAAVLCAASAALAGEESHRAAGGCTEELRAALELDAPQAGRLRTLLREADGDLARIRGEALRNGSEPSRQRLVEWQDRLRARVKEILRPQQLPKYDDWIAFKVRLAGEYDKGLFGLPCATEIKLRASVPAASAEKLRSVLDEGVGRMQAKILELKTAGVTTAEIAAAINDLRKETFIKLVDTLAGGEQRKLREWLTGWLKSPEDKLAATDRDRIEHVMKQLELGENAPAARIRTLIQAVMWHDQEASSLRKSLGKDLVLSLMRAKTDLDMWVSIHEHGALIETHNRRLKALRADLKEEVTTKQVAKLVAEGILE
jgi:hypothetical protein